MGTTKQRKERFHYIIELIKAAPDQKLCFKELYAPLVLEWGIRETTMENYLDSLASAGIIVSGNHPFAGWGKGAYLIGGEAHRRRYNPTPEEKAQDEANKEAFMASRS